MQCLKSIYYLRFFYYFIKFPNYRLHYYLFFLVSFKQMFTSNELRYTRSKQNEPVKINKLYVQKQVDFLVCLQEMSFTEQQLTKLQNRYIKLF